jgi:hypothetical protein
MNNIRNHDIWADDDCPAPEPPDPSDLRIVLIAIGIFLAPSVGALIACIGWHYGWWP